MPILSYSLSFTESQINVTDNSDYSDITFGKIEAFINYPHYPYEDNSAIVSEVIPASPGDDFILSPDINPNLSKITSGVYFITFKLYDDLDVEQGTFTVYGFNDLAFVACRKSKMQKILEGRCDWDKCTIGLMNCMIDTAVATLAESTPKPKLAQDIFDYLTKICEFEGCC